MEEKPKGIHKYAKPEAPKPDPEAKGVNKYLPNPEAKGFKKYIKTAKEIDEAVFTDGSENPLHLPKETMDALHRENVDVMWASMQCMGVPQDRNIATKQANGWQFVEEGDFPTDLVPRLQVDNLRLMARDYRLSQKQARKQEAEAAAPPAVLRQRAGEGDLAGVTLDARHSSARGYNKIRSTFERMEIKDD
jgi:hypothetical protein